MDTIELITLI